MTGTPLRRGVALAALTVACVITGPAPQFTAAIERLYAVAVEENQRSDRTPGLDRPNRAPSGRRPQPSRPSR